MHMRHSYCHSLLFHSLTVSSLQHISNTLCLIILLPYVRPSTLLLFSSSFPPPPLLFHPLPPPILPPHPPTLHSLLHFLLLLLLLLLSSRCLRSQTAPPTCSRASSRGRTLASSDCRGWVRSLEPRWNHSVDVNGSDTESGNRTDGISPQPEVFGMIQLTDHSGKKLNMCSDVS